MKKKNRVIAIVVIVVILLTIFFAHDYIIEKAHHDCTGENCPICLSLEVAIKTITNLIIIPKLAIILAALCVFTHLCVAFPLFICIKKTLITLKVELLN